MKLYATTTSERATKGQGGNEYIVINLQYQTQAKENICFAKILIEKNDDFAVPVISIASIGIIDQRKMTGDIMKFQELCIELEKKDKKQTSENSKCLKCGEDIIGHYIHFNCK